jgi:hypothetical protein
MHQERIRHDLDELGKGQRVFVALAAMLLELHFLKRS